MFDHTHERDTDLLTVKQTLCFCCCQERGLNATYRRQERMLAMTMKISFVILLVIMFWLELLENFDVAVLVPLTMTVYFILLIIFTLAFGRLVYLMRWNAHAELRSHQLNISAIYVCTAFMIVLQILQKRYNYMMYEDDIDY
jgi:hypothetical protein